MSGSGETGKGEAGCLGVQLTLSKSLEGEGPFPGSRMGCALRYQDLVLGEAGTAWSRGQTSGPCASSGFWLRHSRGGQGSACESKIPTHTPGVLADSHMELLFFKCTYMQLTEYKFI